MIVLGSSDVAVVFTFPLFPFPFTMPEFWIAEDFRCCILFSAQKPKCGQKFVVVAQKYAV